MLQESKTIDFSGQDIYAGIDVHLKNWKVTILNELSEHKTFNQPPKTNLLVNYLRRNFPNANYHCAYEAGFSGYWLHEQLKSEGINCLVVHPADIPTKDKERRQKEDKRDSRKIARSLRNGELDPIYVPDRWSQEERNLLRVRQLLVKDQTRCRNRIKSLLYFYGIEYPPQFSTSGPHWSRRFIQWLESLHLDTEWGTASLKAILQLAGSIRMLILETTQRIKDLSLSNKYASHVKLLLTVPGIGRLTAMVLLTELGPIHRFKNLDHLCAYVGLIPNTYSSGEKQIIGEMSRRGNSQLKKHLIESAWTAARKDPALMIQFQRLSGRMHKNKAIIRIARKLLNRIRYVLANQTEYQMAVVK